MRWCFVLLWLVEIIVADSDRSISSRASISLILSLIPSFSTQIIITTAIKTKK